MQFELLTECYIIVYMCMYVNTGRLHSLLTSLLLILAVVVRKLFNCDVCVPGLLFTQRCLMYHLGNVGTGKNLQQGELVMFSGQTLMLCL